MDFEQFDHIKEANNSHAKGCERINTVLFNGYLKNPNLSIKSLEAKTGVPHTTLRRIIKNESDPNPAAVIKIFRAFGLDDELLQYMQDFHPEIASVMKDNSVHNNEYNYIEQDHRQYFTDESNFLILSLAYTKAGTTEEEIQTQLGSVGLNKLYSLTNKGLILKQEDGSYVGKIKDFKLPFADVIKRLGYAMKFYNLEEAGSINNWLSYQVESLNDEGIKALKLLQQSQFIERKEKIFNNPMYFGHTKVYCAAVGSTFLPYKEDVGVLQ